MTLARTGILLPYLPEQQFEGTGSLSSNCQQVVPASDRKIQTDNPSPELYVGCSLCFSTSHVLRYPVQVPFVQYILRASCVCVRHLHIILVDISAFHPEKMSVRQPSYILEETEIPSWLYDLLTSTAQ